MNYFIIITVIILAYLIGSIATSTWTAKWFYGIDIHSAGSGNAGATNMLRTLGLKAGLPVLIIDIFKGWFAVQLISFFNYYSIDALSLESIKVALACSAIIGHIFPIYTRFKGGKGVATTTGTIFAITPLIGLILVGIFLLTFIIRRFVSFSSISCAISFPILVLILPIEKTSALLIFSIAIAIIIPLTHLENIKRLLKKQEQPFNFNSLTKKKNT